MDMGQYEFVKNNLVLFRLCIADRQKSLDALWGQLAASVLDYDVTGQLGYGPTATMCFAETHTHTHTH